MCVITYNCIFHALNYCSIGKLFCLIEQNRLFPTLNIKVRLQEKKFDKYVIIVHHKGQFHFILVNMDMIVIR